MSGLAFSSLEWLGLASAAGGAAAVSYPLMAGSVFLGSVVPVLPTGPIVAASAALAQSTSGLSLAVVVALAAVAAFSGDVVTYAVCRGQGSRALDWLVARHDSDRLRWARAQVSQHGARLIIVGRILPAGRIPVLLAAGSLRYPWKAFLPAGLIAAIIWATLYAGAGVVGGALFDSPLVAVAAAVVLAVLVTAGPALYRRIRGRGRVRAQGRHERGVAGTDPQRPGEAIVHPAGPGA